MADKNNTDFLKTATALIARGFAITPLNGKTPFLTGTDFSCSRDAEQIKRWAEMDPSFNCGVVIAGQEYWAADIDHIDWFTDHCPKPLPKTLIVKTGSGKYHIYFKGKLPSGLKAVKNPAWTKESTKIVPAKLFEFPNQCVGIGSVHPDTQRNYLPLEGYDLPLAECPAEWLAFFKRNIREPKSSIALKPRPLRSGLSLEQVLDQTELAGKYQRFEASDRVFLNYAAGLGYCLIRGNGPDTHFQPGEVINGRQCGFYYMKNDPSDWGHQCFSCGCGNRKDALAALGVEFEDISVPPWRLLFKSKKQLNQEPLLFVADRFIPEGVTGIGGPSGHGKTWMMLSMAKAIRKGNCKLWDLFDVTKSYEVLYMTPEVGDRAINHRLSTFGLDDDEGFLFRTQSMTRLDLDRPELLVACKGRVVILDTLVRWLAGREENSSKDIAQLFDLISDMLSSGAVAIIFAHHSIKGSKQNPWTMTPECVFRGSGDIIANLSAGHGIYQLDCKERDKTLIHIECVKPRDFEPEKPFQIQGRPYTDTLKDFKLVKKPGECDWFLQEKRNYGGTDTDDRAEKITELLNANGNNKDNAAAEFKISVRQLNRILKEAAEKAAAAKSELYEDTQEPIGF